jgi:hypothetical protein
LRFLKGNPAALLTLEPLSDEARFEMYLGINDIKKKPDIEMEKDPCRSEMGKGYQPLLIRWDRGKRWSDD